MVFVAYKHKDIKFAFLPFSAPGIPASFSCKNLTQKAMSFAWSQPDERNGIITGYQLTWASSSQIGSKFFSAGSFSGSVSNLCQYIIVMPSSWQILNALE